MSGGMIYLPEKTGQIWLHDKHYFPYCQIWNKDVECAGCILAPAICAQDLETFACLLFSAGLPCHEYPQSVIFGLAKTNMHVVTMVISESDKILITLDR